MECIFSTLKTEHLSRKIYRTRYDLGADVFDSIGRSIIQSVCIDQCGYLSPVQFENSLSALRMCP